MASLVLLIAVGVGCAAAVVAAGICLFITCRRYKRQYGNHGSRHSTSGDPWQRATSSTVIIVDGSGDSAAVASPPPTTEPQGAPTSKYVPPWADPADLSESDISSSDDEDATGTGGPGAHAPRLRGILKKGSALRRRDSVARIEQYRQEVAAERERQGLDPSTPGRRRSRRLSFHQDSKTLMRIEEYIESPEHQVVAVQLEEKLKKRPSASELESRHILKFAEKIEMAIVPGRHEYDRKVAPTWAWMTAQEKLLVRKELNEFKRSEMEVHQESQHLTRFHEDGEIDEQFAKNIGARVFVRGYGEGVLRFYGPHKQSPGQRCGVELDEPVGKNNGTVRGHEYFRCDPKHGILCTTNLVKILIPAAEVEETPGWEYSSDSDEEDEDEDEDEEQRDDDSSGDNAVAKDAASPEAPAVTESAARPASASQNRPSSVLMAQSGETDTDESAVVVVDKKPTGSISSRL
eukprot:m.106063 g.106063  ORF g.106063 m.106063 type:complete len:462 (-) comp9166_c0_seq1:956-2341(-)